MSQARSDNSQDVRSGVAEERKISEAAREVARKFEAQVRDLREKDDRFVARVSYKASEFIFTQ